MSVVFKKESDEMFIVCVDGVFTYDNLKKVENNFAINGHNQKIKLLLLAEKFSGWSKEGDWGDLTFMHDHDQDIKKIAVVTNEKWKDELLMFLGAGRRSASVEFFFPDDVEDARYWLQCGSE